MTRKAAFFRWGLDIEAGEIVASSGILARHDERLTGKNGEKADSAWRNLRKLTRNGITFYACLNYRLGGPLRTIKKWRGYQGIEDLTIIQAAIRRIGRLAVDHGFELITVPPQSGIGESFAARIARDIAGKSGIPWEGLFADHGQGKRYCIKHKMQPFPVVLLRPITGARVLVFDDFAFTRWTMANAIGALREAGNYCEGIVLC